MEKASAVKSCEEINENDDDESDDDDMEEDGDGVGMKAAYSVDDLMEALNIDDASNDNKNATLTLPKNKSNTCSSDAPSVVYDMAQEIPGVAKTGNRSDVGGSKTAEGDDDGSLYEAFEHIIERKRRSQSHEKEEAPMKIVSDIAGRFITTGDAGTMGENNGVSTTSMLDIAQNGSGCSVGKVNHGQAHEIYDDVCSDGTLQAMSTLDRDRDIYENVGGVSTAPGAESMTSSQNYDDDDAGWSSSEFEDYDDDNHHDVSTAQGGVACDSQSKRSDSISQDSSSKSGGGGPEGGARGTPPPLASTGVVAKGMSGIGEEGDAPLKVPVRRKNKLPSWKKSAGRTSNGDNPSPMTSAKNAVFERIASRISQRSRGRDDASGDQESSSVTTVEEEPWCPVLTVELNAERHPPPELPPAPDGLSSLQLKRRFVVSTIIESETSYTDSLRKIVQDYEQPLLDAKPPIISVELIRIIFYKVRDILQCHNMFQIELAEIVRVWDTENKIGDIFTASFSKSMVFEAYSEYVNNFSTAMETAKKAARDKQAFAAFLKAKLEASKDRLSLFGLMVKPVQRFPQFILLLQDLLKYTAKDHHDRLSLQLALTELDTLTHRLNETKRESDCRREAVLLQSSLGGRKSLKIDADSRLLRQDDVVRIKLKNGETRSRTVRLYLLNNQLACTKLDNWEGDSQGKHTLVWSVAIKDVEIVQPTLPSTYKVNVSAGKSTVSASKSGDRSGVMASEYNPHKKELDDMLHDLTILESMSGLCAQLSLRYDALSLDTLHSMTKSLQSMIRQKCDVDQCILTLSIPVKGGARTACTFQLDSASLKRDWLLELQTAKLAIDPRNHPAWCMSENDSLTSRLPLFIQPLLLDITKEDLKKQKLKKKTKETIQCATSVTLPSVDLPAGNRIQHLWVCNGDKTKGQVAIFSLHTNQPCVIESFRVCDSAILCAETVPGVTTSSEDKFAFNGDTVWMACDNETIVICNVVEEDRGSAKQQTIKIDGRATCIRYLDGCVYVGLKSGALLVFVRDYEGIWLAKGKEKVSLGGSPVSCLLAVNREMLAVCESTLYVINVTMSATPCNKLKSFTCKPNVKTTSHRLACDSGSIECIVKAGVGLMVAFSNSSIIRLFHLETFCHIQDISVASAITPLIEGKEVSGPVADDRKLSSMHITCMLSERGLLWVGTSYGFVLTLPLPRLEGIPKAKGRPMVSFHSHCSPIRFLSGISCASKLHSTDSAAATFFHSVNDNGIVSMQPKHKLGDSIDGVLSDGRKDGDRTEMEFTKSVDRKCSFTMRDVGGRLRFNGLSQEHRSRWLSTPDLKDGEDEEDVDDGVRDLYENLLHGVDADMDAAELTTLSETKQRSKAANFQHNINVVGNRMSGVFSKVVRKKSLVVGAPSTATKSIDFKPSTASHALRRTNVKSAAASVQKEENEDVDETYEPVSNTQRSHDVRTSGHRDIMVGCGSSKQNGELICSDVIDGGMMEDGRGGVKEKGEESNEGCEILQSTTSDDSRVLELSGSSSGRSSTGSQAPPSSSLPPPTQAPSTHTPPTLVTSSERQAYSSKVVIVASGGEGHIYWNERKPFEKSIDDTCLLLWQC